MSARSANPADRSAWLELRQNQDDITHVISEDAPGYWTEIEQTTAWSFFLLERRLLDLWHAFETSLWGDVDDAR